MNPTANPEAERTEEKTNCLLNQTEEPEPSQTKNLDHVTLPIHPIEPDYLMNQTTTATKRETDPHSN